MNCQHQPVLAETYTLVNEIGEETRGQFKIKIDEVKVLGIPFLELDIRKIILGNATLYLHYHYQQENGIINFSNPIDDRNGYTNYFSQKVSAGLIESGQLETVFDYKPSYQQDFGVLTHHLVLTKTGNEKQKCFTLLSASIISRGGIYLTTIIIHARIYVSDPNMMLPLINEVAERVVQEFTHSKKS
ncbi:MAG TPA: hypothetical protein VJH70_02850 [Candidatus Paceibacterota bacterium]